MWDLQILIKNSFTDGLRIFGYFAAFGIPYIMYKINLKLHEIGDPPWKKDKEQE